MAEPGAWIGRVAVCQDILTKAPLERLAALLDYEDLPWATNEVPPLGHWLFHLPEARQSQLGKDGHPLPGDFMPPMAQPRRMWAGSRLTFFDTLNVGDASERRSTIDKIEHKRGMAFVTVRHEIGSAGHTAIIEEQDLVYLPARTAEGQDIAKPARLLETESVRTYIADETVLLRFSALTFNAHRIHYDRPYATGIEHYRGLVVHGPLLATLLMDHALRANRHAHVAAFEFRARAPVICGEGFDLCRTGDDLWVRKNDDTVAMTARVTWA